MSDHNPIKSVKIDFHTADGMTPKPQPLEKPMGAEPAGGAMDKQPAPQTTLSPLHEVLFKHWATANGVQDPDEQNNHYDYRGMYLQSNGAVQPQGAIGNAAGSYNRIMQNPMHHQLQTVPPTPSLQDVLADKTNTVNDLSGSPMMTPGLGHLPPTPPGFGPDSNPSPMGAQPIQQLIQLLHRGQ